MELSGHDHQCCQTGIPMLDQWARATRPIPCCRRWRKARITSDNHAFIRRMVEAVGLTFQAVTNAEPHFSPPAGTAGAICAFTGVARPRSPPRKKPPASVGQSPRLVPSSKLKGMWYVTHPENRVQTREKRTRKMQREAAFCVQCGEQKSFISVWGQL